MAVVYQAVDERLERVVAVKLIQPSHANNRAFLERFEREARTVARLNHPNIVAVYDSGEHDGLPYLVMEYVAGRTLRDVLRKRHRLPPKEALDIIEPVLAAVATAHRNGLVHRDIKPENVLIGDDGTVKVTDFGLARAVEASADDATARGQLIATVAYVAPELVTDGRSAPRSDVYSAGIMLFEMLTGQVPFTGERAVDVAHQHVEYDVPPPSRLVDGIPAVVDEVVLRATRRDPEARLADASMFRAEVRAARGGLNSVARASARVQPHSTVHTTVALPREELPRHRITLPRRRRSGLIVATVLVVLALIAAVGGWWLGAGRYTQAPGLLAMTRAEAVAEAERLGFSVEFDEGQFSETVPVDVVIDQDPEPQGRILPGGTITLTLSLGPEQYPIPELVGAPIAEATEQLRVLGLRPQITEEYSSSIPAGHVISVDPAPGTVVRPGTEVTLVISRGEPPIEVPNVVGDRIEDAEEELRELGLRIEIIEQESEEVREGRVISQSPEPHTGVGPGTVVTLTVSTGPPQVEVPDVEGMTVDEARALLESHGLRVEVYDIPTGDDRVFDQSPEGGTRVDRGSVITLWSH